MSGRKAGGRKRKAPVASQLNNAVKEKKRLVQQNADREAHLTKLHKEKADLEASLHSLVGPENILKVKVHQKRIKAIEREIDDLDDNTESKTIHQLMSMVDQLEMAAKQDQQQRQKSGPQRQVNPETRLLPPRANGRSIFDTMSNRDASKWKMIRAHKKRYEVLSATNHSLKPVVNAIDTCEHCGVDRHVDKETAISVCPKCGSTCRFASHIFESKDIERDEANSGKQQSLIHMQKYSAQFERGYPNPSQDILEPIAVAYSKVHLHDPSKVASCRTSNVLKNIPSVPKVFRRAPDRITKLLKGDSIPEFTSQELSLLLNQRNRLRAVEESNAATESAQHSGTSMASIDPKHKKSFSNQFYLRQLGRTNNMPQARLFHHAKTVRIHTDRTRGLEKEFLAYKQRNLGNLTGDAFNWNLFPNS